MSTLKPKMNIHAYKDEKLTDEIDGSPYVVQLNPSSYAQNYKIEYVSEQAAGSSGKSQGYHFTDPQKLTFDFLFDATGAVKSAKVLENFRTDGVHLEIEQFKHFVYKYQGEIHRPHFLKLVWGRLAFECVLEEMSIEYTLFNKAGIALRAAIQATFRETIEEETRVKQENQNSPDVTHLREIKAGDSLLNLSYEVYGDMNEYWRVVAANNLINFRSLKVGSQILFPAIEKENI